MKDPQDHPSSSALVIVPCGRRPCNESHSPCYSAQPDRMKRCLTTCFACWCFTCLASPLFAGSSLESTLSSAGCAFVSAGTDLGRAHAGRYPTLSGPAYGGRLTGSAQDEASATFIANRFSELRLHRSPALPPENRTNPLPQREWKQTASVPTRTITEPSARGIRHAATTPRAPERLSVPAGPRFPFCRHPRPRRLRRLWHRRSVIRHRRLCRPGCSQHDRPLSPRET